MLTSYILDVDIACRDNSKGIITMASTCLRQEVWCCVYYNLIDGMVMFLACRKQNINLYHTCCKQPCFNCLAGQIWFWNFIVCTYIYVGQPFQVLCVLPKLSQLLKSWGSSMDGIATSSPKNHYEHQWLQWNPCNGHPDILLIRTFLWSHLQRQQLCTIKFTRI